MVNPDIQKHSYDQTGTSERQGREAISQVVGVVFEVKNRLRTAAIQYSEGSAGGQVGVQTVLDTIESHANQLKFVPEEVVEKVTASSKKIIGELDPVLSPIGELATFDNIDGTGNFKADLENRLVDMLSKPTKDEAEEAARVIERRILWETRQVKELARIADTESQRASDKVGEEQAEFARWVRGYVEINPDTTKNGFGSIKIHEGDLSALRDAVIHAESPLQSAVSSAELGLRNIEDPWTSFVQEYLKRFDAQQDTQTETVDRETLLENVRRSFDKYLESLRQADATLMTSANTMVEGWKETEGGVNDKAEAVGELVPGAKEWASEYVKNIEATAVGVEVSVSEVKDREGSGQLTAQVEELLTNLEKADTRESLTDAVSLLRTLVGHDTDFSRSAEKIVNQIQKVEGDVGVQGLLENLRNYVRFMEDDKKYSVEWRAFEGEIVTGSRVIEEKDREFLGQLIETRGNLNSIVEECLSALEIYSTEMELLLVDGDQSQSDVSAIPGPPPGEDGKPVGFEPWKPVNLPEE